MAERENYPEVAELIGSPEMLSEYINGRLRTSSRPSLPAEIGAIIHAAGVSEFARQAGMVRENIYRAFYLYGNPTLRTLEHALGVLGLRLEVVPASPPIEAINVSDAPTV